ncbi:MAG: SidA/IucD/PvdA family monooxygenase, partial [Jatrophihabitantaceae bacterium]
AEPFLADSKVFHVSQHTDRAINLAGLRVGVIGGGQSGAEAFLDLISRPTADSPRRVSWISRRANFFPIDDSPFTNDYYMPDHSDYFASLPLPIRQTFNTTHLLTSDGISESTLRAIYQRIYTQNFIHQRTDLIALYPNRDLTGISRQAGSGDGYTLALSHNHHPEATEQLDLDVLIFATGFRPHTMPFLSPIADRLQSEAGEYRIDDNYAVLWDGPADRNIFLQNATRQQRGLADPNLSLLAWRSQRILDRLRNADTDPQHRSFIEWTSKQPSVAEPE